jgi:hypothetical protein
MTPPMGHFVMIVTGIGKESQLDQRRGTAEERKLRPDELGMGIARNGNKRFLG